MKSFVWKGLIVFIILILVVGWRINVFIQVPLSKEVRVTIQRGDKTRTIVKNIQKEGRIGSYWEMELYLYWKKFSSGPVRAGEYSFKEGVSFQEVAEKMIKGETVRLSFTIPEGFNAREIAHLLEQKNLVRSDSFLKKVFATDAATKFGLEGTTLEGYLFPDTYAYTSQTTEDEILSMMVKNFKKHCHVSFQERTKEMNFSFYQMLILASIIEKETGKEEERKMVSSVFHNRLRQGIPLATDPTVIYGIENFDGNIRKADLLRDGPYNTYLRKGLPPTPIANPGSKSIKAALYPEKTDYLYFVSRGDGSHHFSVSLQEHNEAVKKYQLHQ